VVEVARQDEHGQVRAAATVAEMANDSPNSTTWSSADPVVIQLPFHPGMTAAAGRTGRSLRVAANGSREEWPSPTNRKHWVPLGAGQGEITKQRTAGAGGVLVGAPCTR
jgi:hypothetical protein